MLELERFLRQFGFPLARLGANVSAYARFAAGILILVGAFTRAAAAVTVVLLFHGPGVPSVGRRTPPASARGLRGPAARQRRRGGGGCGSPVRGDA